MAVSGQSDIVLQEELRAQAAEKARQNQRNLEALQEMLRRWNEGFKTFLAGMIQRPIKNIPDQATETLSQATAEITARSIAQDNEADHKDGVSPDKEDQEQAKSGDLDNTADKAEENADAKPAEKAGAKDDKSISVPAKTVPHSYSYSGGGASYASSRPVNFMPKISFPSKERRAEIWGNLKSIDYKDLGSNLAAGAGSALAVKTVIGGTAATLGVAGGLTTGFAIVAGAGVAGASVEALRQYKEEMERLKQEAGGEITSEQIWAFRMQALRSLDKKACAKAFWDKCGAGFLVDAGRKFFSNWSEKGIGHALFSGEAWKEYGSIFMKKGTALAGAAIGVSLADDLPDAADKILRVVEAPAHAQEADPSLLESVIAPVDVQASLEEITSDAREGAELTEIHRVLSGLTPDNFITMEVDGIEQQVIRIDQDIESLVSDRGLIQSGSAGAVISDEGTDVLSAENTLDTDELGQGTEDQELEAIGEDGVDADSDADTLGAEIETEIEGEIESSEEVLAEPINTDGMASWQIHNLAVETLWDGGLDTLENREAAMPLFLEAAAKGSDLAIRDLGDLYDWGYVTEAQITEALGEYGMTMVNPDPSLNLAADSGFVNDAGSVQPLANDNNEAELIGGPNYQSDVESTSAACDDGIVSNGFSTYDYWHLNQYLTHNELFSHPEHGMYFAENWLNAESDPQAIKDMAQRLFWMNELDGNQEVAMALYREAAALGNEQAIRDIEQITSMGLNGYVDPGPIVPCEVPEDVEVQSLTQTFTDNQGQPYVEVDPELASEMLFRDPEIVLPAGAPHTFILGDTRVSLPPPPNDVYASAYCRDMQIIPPGETQAVNACSYAISELELPFPANDVYASGDEPALANNLN